MCFNLLLSCLLFAISCAHLVLHTKIATLENQSGARNLTLMAIIHIAYRTRQCALDEGYMERAERIELS